MTKMRVPRGRSIAKLLASTILAVSITQSPALAQGAGFKPILPDLSGIVKDEDWAKVLGKALFWDEKLGSDGMACASCHFSAGADPRLTNQLSPSLLEVTLDNGNQIEATEHSFGNVSGLMPSGNAAGPNYTVEPGDFPFHQLVDEANRNSDIVTTTNDRMASSGSFDAAFKRIGRNKDRCGKANADVFHVHGRPARTVEPRNTPTMINAVFNIRNFWDGRAKNIFNGKGVFGQSEITNDPTARVIEYDGSGASLTAMMIENASLASQAVGPPLSNLEMSCEGRVFADVGKKMLDVVKRPLATQRIAADDSLFGHDGPKGSVVRRNGKGLKLTYEQLVKKAFHEKYWKAPGKFIIEPDGTLKQNGRRLLSLFDELPPFGQAIAETAFDEHLFGSKRLGKYLSGHRRGHSHKDSYSQMEHNFSLFFGLAVMLYEADLVSDRSRFDVADANGCFVNLPGGPPRRSVLQRCIDDGTFTEKEADGFAMFSSFGPGGAGCIACHGGPLFSDAVLFKDANGNPNPFSPLVRQVGAGEAFHDTGFHNIGSRPVHQDLGLGGTDPWGEPLSIARQVKRVAQTGEPPADGVNVDLCTLPNPPGPPSGAICQNGQLPADKDSLRLVVDGGMKTPGLRNVALTPPYFHYGGYSTLEQVVEFYARGGSKRDRAGGGDDSGTGPTGDAGAIDAETHPVTVSFSTNAFIGSFNPAIDPDNGKDRQYGIEAIADFMRTMTDRRVQCDAAPFDHPSLRVPNGHKANGKDQILKIPAVGKDGAAGTAYGCLRNSGDLFDIQTRDANPS